MKQWPAKTPAEVVEDNILRMQDNAIPNNTKEAMKLGVKVFRGKQCFNRQFANMSSVFCPCSLSQSIPDYQAPLMPLSLNNNYPSTAPFQSPI